MTAAIFGLVGVLIGGAIAVTSQYMLLRRQELRAARAAARLLRVEFGTAMGFLLRSRDGGKWDAAPSDRLKLVAWENHGAKLAAVADRTLWEVLSLAASSLEDLVQATTEVHEGDPIDPGNRDGVAETLEWLIPAVLALESVAEFDYSIRARIDRRRAKREFSRRYGELPKAWWEDLPT